MVSANSAWKRLRANKEAIPSRGLRELQLHAKMLIPFTILFILFGISIIILSDTRFLGIYLLTATIVGAPLVAVTTATRYNRLKRNTSRFLALCDLSNTRYLTEEEFCELRVLLYHVLRLGTRDFVNERLSTIKDSTLPRSRYLRDCFDFLS
jgi:hypothetical protein